MAEFHKKDKWKRKFTDKIHKKIFSVYWCAVIIITEIKSVINRKYVIDRICDFKKNDEIYQITLYVPNLRQNREVLKIIEEEKQKIQLKYFEIEESSNKKVVIKLLAEDSAVLFIANILNQLNWIDLIKNQNTTNIIIYVVFFLWKLITIKWTKKLEKIIKLMYDNK